MDASLDAHRIAVLEHATAALGKLAAFAHVSDSVRVHGLEVGHLSQPGTVDDVHLDLAFRAEEAEYVATVPVGMVEVEVAEARTAREIPMVRRDVDRSGSGQILQAEAGVESSVEFLGL